MDENLPLITRLGGLVTAAFGRTWSGLVDAQIAHYDITADPARPEFQGPVVLAFWHEYIFLPFSMWGRCNIAMLTSQHRDADWLTRAGHHLGYATVRGSSNHGGASALRELKRLSRTMTLAITPDGPRGPRRKMALGPVFLSSRLGLPLVPMGFGFDRPVRLKTWDRFAVPRPFARARVVWGPRMPIPPRLGREGLEHYRQQVEDVLNCITAEAESWAASGTRRVGQRNLVRRPPRIQRRPSQQPAEGNSPVGQNEGSQEGEPDIPSGTPADAVPQSQQAA